MGGLLVMKGVMGLLICFMTHAEVVACGGFFAPPVEPCDVGYVCVVAQCVLFARAGT